MTAKELIEHLQQFPPDAKVSLADPNFGGEYEELDREAVEMESGVVLIHFPCVRAVD